ncbi:MAG TPA: LysM peptidoglycan-binding domain-containing protein [Anaerolineales bacterium]|nr:LysM peptidoglycan-binding domain-containing protein [Anaerolineales bacterium]HNA54176.1 LysM peptidoglycan-binding domain-containing protein [Anaerolineales bacterium]HNB85101.1 LysM peptidoglycan-binding domain-containing protein [Anaerolineales bacterium]HNJ13790.1 LysM peptidoglycan-binding domain-containing protein [Anaerolineales bacterium]
MSVQKKSSFKFLFRSIILHLLAAILVSCAPATATPVAHPTYDPFLPVSEGTFALSPNIPTVTITSTPVPPTATREPTPTRVPLTIILPTAVPTDQPIVTPTPDAERVLPTPRQDEAQYVVQFGDTLGGIAFMYGISVEDLMLSNNLTDANMLDVGMTLNVPAPNPSEGGTSFKVIPDSEMVYGPGSAYFNIQEFIESQNGYLEIYEQDVSGFILSGYEIVWIVARNYSINPRLLLALLEYQSGWVTNPEPFNTAYPMGLADEGHYGLYRQLTWAANTLNQGYYLWKANAISTWVLNDGTVVPVDPTINAGTAAVQYFFAQLDDRPVWEQDVSGTGLLLSYYVFFGNPFDFAIEPLVPAYVSQPTMQLPFSEGETWYFTGGPHGGWDYGSAWAALDFAPPGDNGGCGVSPLWVRAVADGLILRASNGALIQDLDNDGYEQTGWVILYMHVAEEDRVEPGEYVYAGEPIGHASCEGGISNATHLHLARKYNGEWIAADGPLPFNLDGWISSGGGREYDGYLSRNGITIEALDSANELNQVYR